jgi:hypothetical protein
VRLTITCIVGLAALGLYGCSSPPISPYTLASVPNSQARKPGAKNIAYRAIPQRAQFAKIRSASRAITDVKTSEAPPDIGAASDNFEYVRPFTPEWDRHQAEERRRINAAITICRDC